MGLDTGFQHEVVEILLLMPESDQMYLYIQNNSSLTERNLRTEEALSISMFCNFRWSPIEWTSDLPAVLLNGALLSPSPPCSLQCHLTPGGLAVDTQAIGGGTLCETPREREQKLP